MDNFNFSATQHPLPDAAYNHANEHAHLPEMVPVGHVVAGSLPEADVTLPDAALDHMSATALAHLPDLLLP